MLYLFQLAGTGFLTPLSAFYLLNAKRKHKNNLCFLLKFAADRYEHKPALTDGHHQYSFRQLYETVLRLSFVIEKKIGAVDDPTIVLLCDNTPDHILTLLAIQNLGWKLVLVNNKIHANDLEKILQQRSSACYLFTSNTNYLQHDRSVDIQQLIIETSSGKMGKTFSTRAAKLIFPTSGTTGRPKWVEKKSGELYWTRSFTDLLLKTKIHQVNGVFVSIPVSHGFGYTAVLFALLLGKKTLITIKRDPVDIATLVRKEQTDLLVGVPSSLHELAGIFKQQPHPVRSVISGGSAMNDVMRDSIIGTFGKNIFSIYGSTEGSVSFIAGYDHLSKYSHALGVPFKGIDHRLVELPEGGKELYVRSALSNIAAGSCWLATGDLAEKTNEGYLLWCGRKDNMIIRNGVNVYPEEIENHLRNFPGMEDAQVFGQKDDMKGEIIIAVIKMTAVVHPDEESIKRYLKQFLPGYKIPDKIIEADKFEYTLTGKKMKNAIVAAKG